MQVYIFDVEHGSCNAVIAPSGELLLIDCGHNDTRGWRPSSWVVENGSVITNLTITNMDEDHVSDLRNITAYCTIKSLSTNGHLTPAYVASAKNEYGMGPGIRTAVSLMREYTGPSLQTDWGGMIVLRFCHSTTKFSDLNSLSLVTFVQFGGINIVFPGDLTKQAWKEFLNDYLFLSYLRKTNIFIASHHGREDGYCPEIFDFFTPDVILISDKSVQYGTQIVDYTKHATGIRWNQTTTRHVLTTRKDGWFRIYKQDGGFYVTAFGS
jgi:beta-lactamase superfamily II metal-dependent hydrolase